MQQFFTLWHYFSLQFLHYSSHSRSVAVWYWLLGVNNCPNIVVSSFIGLITSFHREVKRPCSRGLTRAFLPYSYRRRFARRCCCDPFFVPVLPSSTGIRARRLSRIFKVMTKGKKSTRLKIQDGKWRTRNYRILSSTFRKFYIWSFEWT